MLPQFALPGEERVPVAISLSFTASTGRRSPDGTTLVILHGSGGNEADLMPIARRIARARHCWACVAGRPRRVAIAGSAVSCRDVRPGGYSQRSRSVSPPSLRAP
jgi:predicted esterase